MPQSPRQLLEANYRISRTNLLLVVLFTAVNIALLLTQSNTYFLFSAFIPYILVDLGMLLCGMYPSEFYEGFVEFSFLDGAYMAVFVGIAAIILALYLLCWFMTKKPRASWMIVALVLFSIDTVGMFWFQGIAMDSIIDIVFHVWVIFSLANGIRVYYKLRTLPDVIPVAEEPISDVETAAEATDDAGSGGW